MKILLTTEYFLPFAPGGTVWSILYMGKRLIAAGHQVTVFTPNYGADSTEEIEGIRVQRYPFWSRLKSRHSTAKVWVHINPFFQIYSALQLVRWVRKNRPDVIHVQEKFSLPFSWLMGRWYGIPVFLTVRDGGLLCPIATCLMSHDRIPSDCGFIKLHRECSEFFNMHYTQRTSWLGKLRLKLVLHVQFLEIKIRRSFLKNIRGVFGVSRATLDLLRSAVLLPPQQEVLYNPPPESDSSPRDASVLAPLHQRPFILFVGKRSLGKGFGVLLDSARSIEKTHPHACFAIAGDQGMQEWGPLPSNVILLGQLSRPQMMAAYDACAMVVFPAIWPDTFSRVPLEAAAAGKCCIGTRKGGTPESILHDETGLLIPPADPEALTTAITDLLDHPEKAARLGARARELLPQRFNPVDFIHTLETMYTASKDSVVGVLPSMGGILNMKQAGQHERLLRYDLTYYARRFNRVYYFSYLREKLEDYTGDPLLLSKVTLIPRPRWISRRLYTFLLPLIQRRLMKQCSILRAYQLTGVIPALISRWLYGIPFVTTYGYDYAGFERIEGRPIKAWVYDLLARLALPRARGVLVTTEEIRQDLQKKHPHTRFCLTPNGVDTDQFSPRTSVASSSNCKLLFIGRLEPQKNLEKFIEALAVAHTPRPIQLHIIGDGSLRQSLQSKAKQMGVNTIFEGVVNHSELPQRLSNADLFVLPSLKEGHPKALLEAMACGLPCAVSSGTGCESVVRNADCGIVFDAHSKEAMTEAIEAMLSNPEQHKRQMDNSRQWALEHFNIEKLMNQEIDFLKVSAKS